MLKPAREFSHGLDLGTAKRQRFLIRNLKVSQSRKQIILFSILPKNEQKNSILVARIPNRSFSFVFWENLEQNNLLLKFTDLTLYITN